VGYNVMEGELCVLCIVRIMFLIEDLVGNLRKES